MSAPLTPALVPLVLERGTKVTYIYNIKETETGPAIDLTGSAFTGQIRRNELSADAITLTVSVTDAEAGEIRFTVDDSGFDLIPEDMEAGVYDILWQQAGGGDKPKLMGGPVTVNPTTTRIP